MTDARVDNPARGDWARCAPLVVTQPVFPGPGGMVSQHAYGYESSSRRHQATAFAKGNHGHSS
jgi:hypothetical protein